MKFDKKLVELDTVVHLVTKGTTPTTIGGRFTEEGINFIKVESISGDGEIILSKLTYIDKESDELLSRSKIEENDILFTIAGTIGRVAKVTSKVLPANTNQAVAIIRPKTELIEPDYLFYILRTKAILSDVEAGVVQAVQKNFSLGMIKKLRIPLPDLDEQKKRIEPILNIDKKIRLNRQINQTLEKIAQAIFKSWFVDFEPVKAKIKAKQNGQDPELAAMCVIGGKTEEQLKGLDVPTLQQLKTTAALFPDTLVESELDEIPEGWGTKEIKELALKISKGTTPRKADIQKVEDAETITFLKVRNISDDGEITRVGLDKIPESIHSGVLKRSMLETNDLLFSIAGTIGRVALVEEDLSNSNCNQAVAFIRLKEPDKYLELCRLNLIGNRVQDEVVSKVVQGVQANFSLTGLGEIKIIIPSEELLANFNKNLGGIGKKQRLLLSENRVKSELRDVLLPKLLSGELNINEEKLETAIG